MNGHRRLKRSEDPSRTERREQLVLSCELDRLHLQLALRPRHASPQRRIADQSIFWLRSFSEIAQILPGTLGRWSRRINIGSTVLGWVSEMF